MNRWKMLSLVLAVFWLGWSGPFAIAQSTSTQTASLERPQLLTVQSDTSSCVKNVMPGLDVTGIHFGIVKERPDGSWDYEATPSVSLIIGRIVGWELTLNATRRFVAYESLWINPAAPKTWNHGPNTVISADKTTAITRATVDLSKNKIYEGWGFLPGDAVGTYKFRISLENHFLCELTLQVTQNQ